MRILVVDDDDIAHTMAARWLHEHHVEYANTLETAQVRLAEGDIDLVLCDVCIAPHDPGYVADQLSVWNVPLIRVSVRMENGVVDKAAEALRSVVSGIANDSCRESIARARCAVSDLEIHVRTKGKQNGLATGNR